MALRIRPIESSSTKLAVVFSAALAATLVLIGIEVNSMSHDKPISPLFFGGILMLMLATCGGLFFISYFVTRRINTITETAERIITTRDITSRIPIDNRWDDLGKLAVALNLMLDEIEQLVQSVRQVSDHIAHDLRTPLTRLRNHIEQLDRASTSPVVRQEEVPQLVAECDGILTTFNALLRIANIESGRRAAVFQPVDLAAVLRDVVELYEPVAHEKQVALSFAYEPVQVKGDKDLLFQALANLLDNAIKYTPEGGVVVARITPGVPQGATITIVDSGPGIADAYKPLVFQRFYRVDAHRAIAGGAGLGLSLVSAIIRIHQGTIALSDREPTGLVVTITLK
ncbi:MAG: sensor histidine kinase [Rickettsiales bacterium]